MNYRHLYHAGNFTDVFKHVILIALIESLLQKPKGFCYLDTHAGIGCYDLQSEAAQKTLEFTGGIVKLLEQELSSIPPLVKTYLAIIEAFNKTLGSPKLRYYPGSPRIVRPFLRSQDRMILTELQPEDFQTLKREFLHDKQVVVHHLDGYQALKAFLPPEERRGLVLIDPPFEQPDEFESIVDHLQIALRRWETGIYAVWYPIKNHSTIADFHYALQHIGIRKILICELDVLSDDSASQLIGCGMAIVHPPWKLEEELREVIPWLREMLSENQLGEWRLRWLVPE